MSVTWVLELVVLLAAIMIGARAGGVGMGLWGGVGLAVLVFGFGAVPGSIPGDVLLIILAVIMAASAMEAAGGIDYLVQIAARIIRRSPRHVTIIAPVVAYAFTFLAGTGHVFYPLLPVNGLMILKNACVTLAARCISGITANEQRCRH